MKTYSRICIAVVFAALTGSVTLAQDPAGPVLNEEAGRIADNQQAQKQVDKVHEETLDLASQYQNKLKVVDGLKVYNALLQKQLDAQEREVATLKSSIANATVIERQMVPLMIRMLDGLEEFIALDVPFLLEEREERGHVERVDETGLERRQQVRQREGDGIEAELLVQPLGLRVARGGEELHRPYVVERSRRGLGEEPHPADVTPVENNEAFVSQSLLDHRGHMLEHVVELTRLIEIFETSREKGFI